METIIEVGAVAPVTYALVAAVRHAGLADRWTPLGALAIGLAVGLVGALVGVVSLAVGPAAFGGILAGAAAVGLHQTGKQLRDDR